jgi:hypothetical protein
VLTVTTRVSPLRSGFVADVKHTPNFVVRGMVDDLRVRCRYGLLCPSGEESASGGGGGDADESAACVRDEAGCAEVLPLAAVAAHEAACGFAPQTCAFTTAQGAPCGARTLRRDAHAAACPHRPEPCAHGCGALLPPGSQARHEEAVCPEVVLLCCYVNCFASMRRCEQAAHDALYLHRHLVAERAAREAYARAAAAAAAAADGADGPDGALMAALRSGGAAGADAAAAAATLALLTLRAVAPVAQPEAWRDACGCVVAAMGAHRTSAAVQLHGCVALRWLSPALAEDAAPAIAALLAALSVHARDADVTSAACAALASVACASAAALASNEGAIPALLAVLDDDSAPETAVEKACHALERIAWAGDDAYAALMDAAAPRAVLRMLRARATSGARVHSVAWLLLFTLMHENAGAAAAAARDGAAALALASLAAHPLHAHVQAQALRALRVFLADEEDVAAAIVLGAADAVLCALSRHGCDASVMEDALFLCGVFILSNGAGMTLAQRSAALPFIVAAMGTHLAAEGTQLGGLYAMRELLAPAAIGYEQTEAYEVANAGGIEAVVAAMRAHADSAELQTDACTVLDIIFRQPSGCTRGVDAGAPAALLAALTAHPRAAELHAVACVALMTLLTNAGTAATAAAINEHGLAEVLLRMVAAADEEAAAHSAVCILPSILVCLGHTAPALLLPRGFAEALASAAAAHAASSARVHTAASDALLLLYLACSAAAARARVMAAMAGSLQEHSFANSVARRRSAVQARPVARSSFTQVEARAASTSTLRLLAEATAEFAAARAAAQQARPAAVAHEEEAEPAAAAAVVVPPPEAEAATDDGDAAAAPQADGPAAAAE